MRIEDGCMDVMHRNYDTRSTLLDRIIRVGCVES